MEKKSKTDLSFMADKWPSAIVARKMVGKFTGGMISPKYCANLDSKGEGCPDRIRASREICYPVKSFIRWLESRASIVE